MNTPDFFEGKVRVKADDVVELRNQVVAWASEGAWRYVCRIGVASDSVLVEMGPEGFEWIVFVIRGNNYAWNPDDGVDEPDGELALAAALASRVAR